MIESQNYLKQNSTESKKFAQIAEMLGILEEKNKGKAWLLNEIKKHKIKVKTKPSMNSFDILCRCPDPFRTHIHNVLKNEDLEDFVDIKTITKSFHWFYTDIVGSALPEVLTQDQAIKVLALNKMVGRSETFRQWNDKHDVMTITGDGMAIGFSDSPEKPLRLAIELHKIISKYNESKSKNHKLKVRIGLDDGPVYVIKDLSGKDNFWGPGIILTKRVMDLAGPMQILASSRFANLTRKLSNEYKSIFHNCGEYKIKHGEELQIYNIYGEGWGNKACPKRKEEPQPNPQKFVFPRVELDLVVTNPDPKIMMTHHSWLWNVVNIAKENTNQVAYVIDGDVPKAFEDLHITVRDENNKKIKGLNLNQNKPLQKRFVIIPNKPIKPNQKRRLLKLEYDWEEPERKYVYQLGTDCKKFKFSLTVPKRLEIKPRILKIDPATKTATHVLSPPVVNYYKNRTEITWKAINLKVFDTYQFEW